MKTKKRTFKICKLSELPIGLQVKAQQLDPLCTTETQFKFYNDNTLVQFKRIILDNQPQTADEKKDSLS